MTKRAANMDSCGMYCYQFNLLNVCLYRVKVTVGKEHFSVLTLNSNQKPVQITFFFLYLVNISKTLKVLMKI